jgi:hypothetical protein
MKMDRRNFLKLLFGSSLASILSYSFSSSIIDNLNNYAKRVNKIKSFYPGINFQAYWDVDYPLLISMVDGVKRVSVWKGFKAFVNFLEYLEYSGYYVDYDSYVSRRKNVTEHILPSDIVRWAKYSFSKFLTFVPFYGDLYRDIGYENMKNYLKSLAKECSSAKLDLGLRVTMYHDYPDFKGLYKKYENESLDGLLNFSYYLAEFSKEHDNVFIQLDEPNWIGFDEKVFEKIIEQIKHINPNVKIAVSIERDRYFLPGNEVRLYKDREPKRTINYWKHADIVMVVDYFSPLEEMRNTLRKFRREVGDKKLISWFSIGDFRRDSFILKRYKEIKKSETIISVMVQEVSDMIDIAYEEADGYLVFDPAGAWLAAGFHNPYDSAQTYFTIAKKNAELTGRVEEFNRFYYAF